ncbi:hypothetical protein [Actinoplanes regularis]|uniref:Uncharacterized protein n=1 Tax=Actinoplanes regularis TaxID=52697 RepID=A0A238XLT5_9ACTN|nr:hypothetical protein [Actinoplanes regularis]SNR59548.1 hypothetical protein SAMN06264365_103545 [Actinoplanes regularis]
MRHLRSILYTLVLAPALWVLAAVGFTHDLTSRGRDFFAAESLSGLLLLIFAGILFAIMVFSPISPAGPTIAGAAYLGVTYWAWNAPQSYADVWPPNVVKDNFDLSRPGYGLAALLAVPLLCTALSARRWARYEPPVLPIIGEIGRFRGSAKVAGVTMAAAETTVLPAARGFQRPADPTVAIPSAAAADKTQVLRTPPAAAIPTQPAAAKADPEPKTVAIPAQPAKADAEDKTVAIPAQPAAAKADAEPKTVAIVATRPDAEDKTVAIPAQRADDTTHVIKSSDEEATEVLSGATLVTPPGDHTDVLEIPAKKG